MENYSKHNLDITAILLMHRIRQNYLQQHRQLTTPCLLLEEKLIYSHILLAHPNYPSLTQLPPIKQLIIDLVQKVNQLAMQTLEREQTQFKEEDRLLNKCISLLMMPQVEQHIGDASIVSKLKVLSFNNLSCVYKQKRKYGVAMRAIDFAVKLEEELIKTQPSEQKYDIIPTYLNKAAVYSQMKRHTQAISTIQRAQAYVQTIQGELGMQIERTADDQERKRLLQKRYYGMYMKMIIYYNLGAEKEHLKLVGQAVEYYRQSKQVAIIIDNQLMISKLSPILEQLAPGHQVTGAN